MVRCTTQSRGNWDMKRSVIAALGVAVIATLGVSSAARASVISFDFSALNGSIIHDGTSLSDSTFLDLDGATELVTSVGNGHGDDSGLKFGDLITLTGATTPPFDNAIIYGSTPGPLEADVILTWPMTPAPGADTFVETLTTVTAIDTNSKDPNFIGVTLTGTLTDFDGHFKGSPVELTFSATQTPGNLPSVAFSNASTVSTIPEPSTWVMITLGFGALGCAAFCRRKADVAVLSA
jgi:PEP-CTERM motif